MREVFANYTDICIASIDVIAGKPSPLAEILIILSAEIAGSVRETKPGDTDTIAFFEVANVGAPSIDDSDNLVSGNDGNPGQCQVTLYDVQIGMAHAAATNTDANFSWSGLRFRDFGQPQWSLLGGSRLFQEHRAHGVILVDPLEEQAGASDDVWRA
jgi:hypothetical protein